MDLINAMISYNRKCNIGKKCVLLWSVSLFFEKEQIPVIKKKKKKETDFFKIFMKYEPGKSKTEAGSSLRKNESYSFHLTEYMLF